MHIDTVPFTADTCTPVDKTSSLTIPMAWAPILRHKVVSPYNKPNPEREMDRGERGGERG